MALYSFQLDRDNHAMLAVSGTDESRGIPPGNAACTQAQFEEWGTKSQHLPGTKLWRWTFIDNVLAEVADDRQRVTWSDPDGVGTIDGNGDLTVHLDVGDPEVNVALSLPGSANKTERPLFAGNTIKLDFVSGTATIAIKTDVARRIEINRSDLYRHANNLTINVHAVKL